MGHAHAHEHGGNVFAIARSLGVAPENIVDFSASINPLGMAPGVPGALASCTGRLLHYPDKTAPELREALAAYHAVHPEQLTVANGSTELIHLLPRVVSGRRALIVSPAFAEYTEALTKAGWEIDYLPLESRDGFRFSLSALDDKLKEGYDLLFICNPANPTGAIIPLEEIAGVFDLCRRQGTFLALDEAFIDFCEEESAKALMVRFERGVILRSMTKFFAMPGLRLGYAIGAADTIAALASFQDPWSVNTAAQIAGIVSLADTDYVQRTREYVASERVYLKAGLDELGWLTPFPSRANYLLAEIRNGVSSTSLRQQLMRQGVLIRDCSNFLGLDSRFFRVAVRLREENHRLLTLLSKNC